MLSLIQAPGSGSVTLYKNLFTRFNFLVGLEIKGYATQQDTTSLTGDAFADLQLLSYLNLETVHLSQMSVENNLESQIPRILRINYTFNDIVTNEVTSQLLLLSPDFDTSKNDSVLPYFEYKKVLEKERHEAPLSPKFRVAFTALPKLQHLKISGCNLHDISWDMFYKLDNLKFLLLDENDLLFLPDFVFYATSNLTTLSLSNNKILNLQTVGLAGLLYLQKLDVTRNNITHLSELSLPPFPHLEVADFRHNPISSIFPNTFEIMNSTKSLYLGSTNTPLDLSPNSFSGLVSLVKLDITNVKIRLLEKSMLAGIPQLTTLIMTGEIPKISFDAFGEVAKLERLIIRNCGIKKISMDALFGLTALQELDLSHNSLTFLPPGIFEDQVSLREVFLQHNKLATLPPTLIEGLPVKIIRLEANPWHCSCAMKNWNPQIVNRVKRYHILTPNATICKKAQAMGSSCFENNEPKFEVTYSYEKRVSPVCESPFKFNQRSVFQVLRKELRYCKNVPKKNSEFSTEANGTMEIGSQGKNRKASFPQNYSANTLKALEKQLLAKPQKPKKIRQEPQPSFNNSQPSLEPTNALVQNTSTFSSSKIPLPIETSENNKAPEPEVDNSPWLPTIKTKSKLKDKKKSKSRHYPLMSNGDMDNTIVTNNFRPAIAELPKVSSKSLKLNSVRTSG